MISCQPCDKMVARWSFRALSCRVYTLTARALFFYFGAKNGLNLFRGFFQFNFSQIFFCWLHSYNLAKFCRCSGKGLTESWTTWPPFCPLTEEQSTNWTKSQFLDFLQLIFVPKLSSEVLILYKFCQFKEVMRGICWPFEDQRFSMTRSGHMSL